MSKFVRQWVQSIEIRKIRVRNEREGPYDTKPLTPAHKEVLLLLATKARDNGRTWMAMEKIAEATGTLRRQAQRNVRDLERARGADGRPLLKTEVLRGRRGRGRYECNEYWVAVPWVDEPDQVSDLAPQPINIERRIDVDDYVRRGKLGALNASPVTHLEPAAEVNASPVTHLEAVNASPEARKCVTGDQVNASPVTPQPGSFNPALNPALIEPGSARERAREADQKNSEGRSDDAHTLGLPGGFSLSRLDGGPPGDLRAAEVWTAALELLRARVGEPIFGTYLADTEAEWFDATAAVLALTSANPFHVPWLEGKLAGVIDQAVREVVDRPVRVEWSKPREGRPPVRPRPAPRVAAAVVS